MDELSGRDWRILIGDTRECLRRLPPKSVHCCITSPPYWGLRDYGTEGQIGLERTPDEFIQSMLSVFREVHRVLRDDGTLWLNLGDSYCSTAPGTRNAPQPKGSPDAPEEWANMRPETPPGMKPKDLCGIPWSVALALRAAGWYLRCDIIWHKPNPMPESVTDRPTKAHEYLFLLTKAERYFYDAEAVKDKGVVPEGTRRTLGTPNKDGNRAHAAGRMPSGNEAKGFVLVSGIRNKRSVWTIATQPYAEAHFATFPEELPANCIKAGTSEKGCCPECGAPWVRVTEKERRPTRPGTDSKVYEPDDAKKQDALGKRTYTGFNQRWRESQEVGNRDPQRHVTETRTKGWQPTCECGGEPVPCTVLDCFAGSGTTIRVANLLGRIGIGCELNPEYAAMAQRRITARSTEKPVEPLPGQKELFS